MSGVDQMKIPGNSAKSPEERNIPWSQQVDEAAYENSASPTNEDDSAGNQSSMQFQYPPFNAKENLNTPWNNINKSRKPPNNYDSNKKYGKPGLYNNTKRDDYQANNAWGPRRMTSDNSTGNYNRLNRSDDGYSSSKLDNRPNDNAEENKLNSAPAVAVAKKTTWASIASQPAKLTLRTTLTTSSHKKKGPGMPPPPMVPGKHNLDVNTWDLPNNNPPPIPSPPPPIDLACADINSDFSLNVGFEQPVGQQADKVQKGPEFSTKDDNRPTLGNNGSFGRVRSSPNGHARKNWSTQNSLHQQRAITGNSSTSSAPIRRAESGHASIRVERRNNYPISRSDYDGNSRPIEGRDENSPRNVEIKTNVAAEVVVDPQALLEELRVKNNYNPAEIDLETAASARFFVIKSYSEDDIHRSIKYEIWCSTDHGNKRLDDAFKERQKDGGNILLFFSVNGSGHFCGMAQMMTAVDYNSTSSVWSQDKWRGKFKVKWIYVKDVPNAKLRHIRLENNDNKSVTNSRDTQEVPNSKGIEVLQILHTFKHNTSIFDDFSHYEKKQEEEVSSKRPPFHVHDGVGVQPSQSPINRHFNRQNDDRDRERDSRDNRGIGSAGIQKFYERPGFRDRNIHRSGGFQSNYNNEFRRGFDGQRTVGSDYQQKDKESGEQERDNDFGVRHIPKFEYNRWDDQSQTKSNVNYRDRDISSEQNRADMRFRVGVGGGVGVGASRDLPKDNEKERVRNAEY